MSAGQGIEKIVKELIDLGNVERLSNAETN
jgi:hypothetical protein